jgi:predicted enzyme related to lactoylglutathione lyase
MNPIAHWELFAKNAPALGRFYADLFGWHLQPLPEIDYVLIDTRAGAGINGGIATVADGSRRPLFYVEVDDLQPALDSIQAAGATMTLAPITEVVTFAQFADPEGTIVGLLKRGDRSPVSSGDAPPVTRFNIASADPSGLANFYRSVFGWGVRQNPHDPSTFDVDTGASGICGTIGSVCSRTPGVTFYASVQENLDAYLDRAYALGATPTEPANDRRHSTAEVAHVVDPEGQTFGLTRQP